MGRFLRSSRWHRTRALGAVVVTVAAGLLVLAAPASAETSAALYTPNISANPNEDASYPRSSDCRTAGPPTAPCYPRFPIPASGRAAPTFPSIDRPTTAKRGPVHRSEP